MSNNRHTGRVERLAGKAKIGSRAMTCQDMVRLMDILIGRDTPDYREFTPDPAVYTAACNTVARDVNWPTHSEMSAILRQSDELLAAEAAAGRL